ncbi:bifunctional ornithine acetyltransferase/N-acetylglutamate synthase [Anaeromyxobacter diazotrophicus]|uniref:Arginine biosynthesis bifunctional protein ArgJ n=1 Tax=Anaeromyxobacter diazotrophicus TaxID=2590199 RepID=A0A7I9VR32_9BACT|nr:bifunctional ornithine acetyltransferase/N-acetylglutamate synthase [Anaeromyxobacter diazotrophicus]GEJ58539.1 arginine biosynthesis bifunctional protein ArgJ [Anaeromyxobacter diazotrophicus]
MPSTSLAFASAEAHRAWLETQAALPAGFRVGTASFAFTPVEVSKPSKMNLTLLALDRPTDAFALALTTNAFPGAPILVARQRREGARLGAVVVNNKVSNVCAPGGVEAAERVCAAAGRALGLAPDEVLPASTGVIGWRLPDAAMVQALPGAAAALQPRSVLPAAEAIMTTDLYPKVRRAEVGGGAIVGIAKGAGMIEPNLATMLVFLLTDLDVARDELRAALDEAIEGSFHGITVDSDTSTSDMVVLLASRARPAPARAAFRDALRRVCRDLAEDLVRNGEGVHHVLRLQVSGAPDRAVARAVGKAVANSPLFQCAVNGNDPNVGRLLCAIGKHVGAAGLPLDMSRVRIRMGGELLLEGGLMQLDPAKEERLVRHLRAAELYASAPPADGLTFRPPLRHPPHERSVELEVDLGVPGGHAAEVLGADRSHEYITENADYRS